MKTQRETPEYVVNRILKLADISYVDSVLEPSAGDGKIVDALRTIYPDKNDITCVELNFLKAETLNSKGYVTINGDFLLIKDVLVDHGYKFHKIIAAPPFKDNIDLSHIMAMHKLLYPIGGSCLVSLTTPYWTTNNEPRQVEFRKWLEGKTYTMEMVPDNMFVEKGRTVPTAIIKIWK